MVVAEMAVAEMAVAENAVAETARHPATCTFVCLHYRRRILLWRLTYFSAEAVVL